MLSSLLVLMLMLSWGVSRSSLVELLVVCIVVYCIKVLLEFVYIMVM